MAPRGTGRGQRGGEETAAAHQRGERRTAAAVWREQGPRSSSSEAKPRDRPTYLVGRFRLWPTMMTLGFETEAVLTEYRLSQLFRPWALAILDSVSPALTV